MKLFSKNSQLQYVITVPQRHGQTDRQTDGQTTCRSNRWNHLSAISPKTDAPTNFYPL